MPATDAPAAKPEFFYVVISPFLGHAKGDVIRDAAAIAAVEKDFLPHVVRVAASA